MPARPLPRPPHPSLPDATTYRCGARVRCEEEEEEEEVEEEEAAAEWHPIEDLERQRLRPPAPACLAMEEEEAAAEEAEEESRLIKDHKWSRRLALPGASAWRMLLAARRLATLQQHSSNDATRCLLSGRTSACETPSYDMTFQCKGNT